MKQFLIEVPRQLSVTEIGKYVVFAETEEEAIQKAMDGDYDDNDYETYDSEIIDTYWHDVEVSDITEGGNDDNK